MGSIRCVIFDVGGVLLSENIDPVFDNLNRRIGKKIFARKDKEHEKALCGKIKEQDYYRNLSKKSGVAAGKLQRMFTYEYIRTMKIDKKVLKIAKILKRKGYKAAILSNITERSKNINKKRGLFRPFSTLILSCDEGCMKPQKKIFEIAVKKIRLKPQECVYMDDRKEFLAVPQKMGMKTIHFSNARKLVTDLRRLGVKI